MQAQQPAGAGMQGAPEQAAAPPVAAPAFAAAWAPATQAGGAEAAQQLAAPLAGGHAAGAAPEPVQQPAPPGAEPAPGAEQGQHPPGLHHLTRHWLPEEARGEAVLERLGAPDIKTAEQMIRWVLGEAECGRA